MKRLSTLLLAGAAMFAPLAAYAAPMPIALTLSGPISGNLIGPQSTSNPCIIAATECQQPAGFGFNNFTESGAISSYNMFSTTPTATVADGVHGTPYTVAQLTAAVGTQFSVAIDVNTTGAQSETLQLFEVIINGQVAYDYHGPTSIGNVANNGNGWADWTLDTINLSGRASTDQVEFHAYWTDAVDGGESFFLVKDSAPDPVPEPASLGLLGLGLLGTVAFARRRTQ